MVKRELILVSLAVMAVSIFVQPPMTGAYPTKPIEVIVPFTAGGTNDLLTRLVGEISKKYLDNLWL